jgi:hypothetical protein
MKKLSKSMFLVPVFAVLLCAAMLTTNVFADENDNPHAIGSPLEVHIFDSGKVLVRGAKVINVTGPMINATTTWGSYVTSWTVNTSSSSAIFNRPGGHFPITDIKVGDFISFTGKIDTSKTSLTVNAGAVKDWSKKK